MTIRVLLVALMVLGGAWPAEARVLDMDTARYNDAIAAFYKRFGYRVLNRETRDRRDWHLASVGAASDLKLQKHRFADGEGWAFSYRAGGKHHVVRFAGPGLDALGRLDAAFIRTDLQELVVFATESVRPNHHLITYRVQRGAQGHARFVVSE